MSETPIPSRRLPTSGVVPGLLPFVAFIVFTVFFSSGSASAP
ncbi:MAG TPA: hypothetical protein VLX89_03500 [Actinomycetota bacterium]|nr:hypothetical protein [Actinomycetota bacterium]